MTFGHLNRRIHLYLALLLLPWFLMYGLSSLPLSHAGPFRRLFGQSEWKTRIERPFPLDLPADADLEQAAARLAAEAGIEGDYFVLPSSPDTIKVLFPRFITPTQITYVRSGQHLVVADRSFSLPTFLTGLHARGGFERPSLLSDAWAVVVDLVCLAMLLWIASGLYMWWSLRHTRVWGLVALTGGVLSFAGFLWGL